MATTEVSLEQLEAALQRLPVSRHKQVLLFIAFLEYVASKGEDEDEFEDEDLWNAVLAHQAYREAHQDEAPEVFDSPEAFLRATENL